MTRGRRCLLGLVLFATAVTSAETGAIEVRLENYRTHDESNRVQVRSQQKGMLVHRGKPKEDGTCVLRGIEPGKHVIEVLVVFKDERQLLAEEPVEVVGGQTTQVTIRLADPLDPALRVPFDGTLEIPKAWGAVDLDVSVSWVKVPPWTKFTEVAVKGTKWSCPQGIVPGVYAVCVKPMTHHVVVDVGRDGVRGLKITVPEPIDVHIRAVDADSGAAAALERVSWYAKLPPGVEAYSPVNVTRAADGAFRFRAPKGGIVVGLPIEPDRSPFYNDKMELDIGPGPAQASFVVRRECGVILKVRTTAQLTEGGVHESELGITLKGDGTCRGCLGEPDRKQVRVYLTQPGTYEVGSDMLGVPAQTVVVKPGEFAEIGGR